jgi:hypothetical protein
MVGQEPTVAELKRTIELERRRSKREQRLDFVLDLVAGFLAIIITAISLYPYFSGIRFGPVTVFESPISPRYGVIWVPTTIIEAGMRARGRVILFCYEFPSLSNVPYCAIVPNSQRSQFKQDTPLGAYFLRGFNSSSIDNSATFSFDILSNETGVYHFASNAWQVDKIRVVMEVQEKGIPTDLDNIRNLLTIALAILIIVRLAIHLRRMMPRISIEILMDTLGWIIKG